MLIHCYACKKEISGHAYLYTDGLNRHYCDSNCRDRITGEWTYGLYDIMTERFQQYLNDIGMYEWKIQ